MQGNLAPVNICKYDSTEDLKPTRNLSRLVAENETSDGGDGAEEDGSEGDFFLACDGTVVQISAAGSVACYSVSGSCIVCLSAGDFESPHLGHGHHLWLRSRIFEIVIFARCVNRFVREAKERNFGVQTDDISLRAYVML